MLKKSLLLFSTVACAVAVYAGDDAADMQSKGKCKKFNTLTVCGNITAGSLNVSGNESVGGNLAVSGNETIGGNLAVTGNETVGGTFAVTGASALTGQLTLTNPVIAVAAGGNLLDYAYFSTSTEVAVASGNNITFDSAPFNSAGITLAGDLQTITFVNAGIYLVNAYVNGESTAPNTGFELSFGNPGGGLRFSGAVQTASTMTAMSGSAVVACTAGRTMTVVNVSTGALLLSDADIVGGSSVAGITIVRIQ